MCRHADAPLRTGDAMAGYELRAMSIGEIIDGSFTIYRRHFGTLITIAVICVGLPALINIYLNLAGGPILRPGLWFLSSILGVLGGLLSGGATVYAISQVYLGQPPTAEQALRRAFSRFGKLLLSGLFKYLIIWFGMILLLVPGFIAMCGLSVVVQAIVIENPPSATAALGRSWSLTRGYKGKAFVLGLAVFIVLAIPMVAAAAVVGLVGAVGPWVNAVSQILSFLLFPVLAAAFTLFYYDLRVRQEAFDLEVLTQTIEHPAPA